MTKETSGATRSRRPALVLLALLQKFPWQHLLSAPMVPDNWAFCVEHISLEAQPFTVVCLPPTFTERMKIMLVWELKEHQTNWNRVRRLMQQVCYGTCWCDAVVLFPLTVQSCGAALSTAAEALFTIWSGFAGLCNIEHTVFILFRDVEGDY